MVQQGCFGKIAHRPPVAVRQDLQDAPLLDGYAFGTQPSLELAVDLAVRLGEQIGEVVGDGRIGGRRIGHDQIPGLWRGRTQ